jgi:secreted Zn-dependent insulinase-like peptidase
MSNRCLSNEQRITYLNDMDVPKFLKYKDIWLRNVSLEWLIQGHITEERALTVVDQSEEALNFQGMDKDLINLERCIKLKEKTVYQKSEVNVDKNVNNCCIALFTHHSSSDKQ